MIALPSTVANGLAGIVERATLVPLYVPAEVPPGAESHDVVLWALHVSGGAAAIDLAIVRPFQAAAHAWFDRRTEPRGPGTMECVHCSDDVTILLTVFDGEIDHWLLDGQEIACAGCGCVNHVRTDPENGAWFADCDEDVCAGCGRGEKGATSG